MSSNRSCYDSDSEDNKRRREKGTPECSFKRSNKIKTTPIKKKEKPKEVNMDEVKNMFAELMEEINQIKKNQREQTENMEKILKENE
ncbi:hypothetical protein QE152_g9332 [Popillia japonica]|uniref:Uncharacterized protein n=1 Tax=Popillia japonica TaxID=7064 RepID=A0AAW1LZK9_POPJA